jgi:phage terminase Nu1 subunit (DNA packaging protein)
MDEHPLTEAQIDAIAEKAARRALQIVYAEVGQNVLKKLAWLTGVIILGLALWLAGKNSLPLNQ